MNSVVAGSTSYLTVNFFDEDGNPAAPSTLSYKVDNLDTGDAIRASTSLTPATSVEITLTASLDNVAPVSPNAYDTRRVTVTAVYPSAQTVQYFDYVVIDPARA